MIQIVTTSRYKLNKKKIIEGATQAMTQRGLKSDDLIVIICVGRRKMKEMARQFNKNYIPPLLTFPYSQKDEDGCMLHAEIVLCYPLAVLLASEREKRVDQLLEELVVHGINSLIVS